MADANLASPRVNSARMPNFIGTTVHLPCKVLKVDLLFRLHSAAHADPIDGWMRALQFQDSSAIVEACDGGQVEVRLHPVSFPRSHFARHA